MKKVDNDLTQLSADDKAAWDAHSKRMTAIYQELRPLEPEHRTAGHVWVYVQRTKAKASAAPGSPR